MHMHSGAVVVEHRLGHERCRFAVFPRHVANDVLVDHHVVCSLDQLRELHSQFVLSCTGNLMVMLLDGYSELVHHQQHLGADVLGCVIGRDGKIPLLQLNLVGEVASLLNSTGVPGSFDRIDAVEGSPLT